MATMQAAATIAASAVVWICLLSCADASDYLIGVGKADATGPAADVSMMGYGRANQKAAGIHTRLYARAFVIADPDDFERRFVFVNVDACMQSQAVTIGVLDKLENMYGGLYNQSNVAISGIHTHSGPGGFLQYILYIVTSLGFVKQSYNALVDGIVQAVKEAHDKVALGKIRINSGDLLDASVNRSPSAYLENPPNEQAKYEHNTDKKMTLLQFIDLSGRPLGSLNWFAVHCTSLNNTNELISGDNKGAAEQMMEKWGNSKGNPGFVAAFAQSNVGDVSPNTLGPICINTGKPCDFKTSTCDGKNELCIGRGPGWPDMFESNRIIGEKQYKKAVELWGGAEEELEGPIDFRHMYVDMTDRPVAATTTTPAGRTCKPAMGYSFAAGTTDGHGDFDFKQGTTKGNLFWNTIVHFIRNPTKKQKECQAPKPILLDTGEMHVPYAWQPAIVDVQILRVGQLVILCVPGEFTTMSGRRLREAVYNEVKGAWGPDIQLVVAGLTNTYSSYITTYEEYQVQRYEGASTIFGPHTLQAYIEVFTALAQAMVNGIPVSPGPFPPELVAQQWSFLPKVYFDAVPFRAKFGDIITDVQRPSFCSGEIVEAKFRSAEPRNDLRTNSTFLTVEFKNTITNEWTTVFTDNDLSTKFHWSKTSELNPHSTATIQWTIPYGTPPGSYRLKHFGNWKSLYQRITPFNGTSGVFEVEDCSSTYTIAVT